MNTAYFSKWLAFIRQISVVQLVVATVALIFSWHHTTSRLINFVLTIPFVLIVLEALLEVVMLRMSRPLKEVSSLRYVFTYGMTWPFLRDCLNLGVPAQFSQSEFSHIRANKEYQQAFLRRDIKKLLEIMRRHIERRVHALEHFEHALEQEEKSTHVHQRLEELRHVARVRGIPEERIETKAKEGADALQKLIDAWEEIEQVKREAGLLGLTDLVSHFSEAVAARHALSAAKALQVRASETDRPKVDQYLRAGDLKAAEGVISRATEVRRLRESSARLAEPDRLPLRVKLDQLATLMFDTREYRILRHEIEKALA